MLEETNYDSQSDSTIELIHEYENTLLYNERAYFDVDQFEEIIDHYFDNGILDKANETVNVALSVHPQSTGLRLRLAQLYIDDADSENALMILNELEKIEPSNHDIYLLKGAAYILKSDIIQADIEFHKSLDLITQDKAEILYTIGVQYCLNEIYSPAINYFNLAIKENNIHYQAIFELGFCYEKEEKLEKSLETYQLYIENNPFSDAAWFNIGTIQGRLNHHDDAIEAFDFALAINPSFYNALFNKANAFACLNKFENAVISFEEFIEYEPEQSEAYCYLAECYEKLHKLDKAKENYQIAVNKNDTFTEAWLGLGSVQSMLGQHEQGLASLNKALELDTRNTDIWYSLGKVFIKLQETERAFFAFKQSVIIDTFNHDSWLSIADLYFKTNQLPEAISTLFESIKTNKNIASLHFRLAGFLALSGKNDEALSYLDKGLRLNYYDYCEFLKIFPKGFESEIFGKILLQHKPLL